MEKEKENEEFHGYGVCDGFNDHTGVESVQQLIGCNNGICVSLRSKSKKKKTAANNRLALASVRISQVIEHDKTYSKTCERKWSFAQFECYECINF